ncbi:MAG: DUF2845 domain-containing protein [Pseudomonadota bacterium]
MFSTKIFACISLLVTLMLFSEPAEAFRCGSKLVKDGMHEAQVVAICGEPTTARNLGYAVRGYSYDRGRRIGQGHGNFRRPGFGLSEEVIITEYVYNFGPRKLMRRLVFEGGVLVTIESLGYGYRG